MATKPAYREIDRMGNSCQGRGGRRPDLFLLHTQQGNGTAESLANYLNNPDNGVSYHYTVRDGVVVDVVDTDLASWSVGDANGRSINLCFAGSFAEWSREEWLERKADLRIAAWFAVQDARKYRFEPRWLGSGGRYRQGNQGVADHQYVTDVIGWGTHTDCGPGFPGDVFEQYLAEYAGAALTAPEGDEMPSVEDIAKAVWSHRLQTPDGSRTETAGNLLSWGDKHTADAVDQLAGPGSAAQRDGLTPTGWPQLGTNDAGHPRSVVDGLAAALSELALLTAGLAELNKVVAGQYDAAKRLLTAVEEVQKKS
jgi:hypothetical protein